MSFKTFLRFPSLILTIDYAIVSLVFFGTLYLRCKNTRYTDNLALEWSIRMNMNETQRQYEFMEKAKGYVKKQSEELGRPLTYCVTTFGCQMNVEPVTA